MVSKTATESVHTYDEVPYRSFAHPHTHPDNMAVIGSLFGMSPPDLETARVLELGSAGGGNIFPLALRYPKARFIGLDLSQAHIDDANAIKKKLGLRNISFEQKDILDFDLKKHHGAFDYIICHGVYSWVPEAVSAKILDICRDCLSDNGLAVITYNALPGWNAVRSLREMMRFHSGRFPTPAEKISEARRLLKFLHETAEEGSYKRAIEEEMAILGQNDDSYLYHDHLEGINRQFYFHEFVDELQKHGLGYVGDCHVASMYVDNLTPAARETLKTMGNLVLLEQYMDFVRNRRFRSSIICKAGIPLRRDLRNTQILDYHFTANMGMEQENPDFTKPVKFSIRRNGHASFTTNNEIVGRTYHEIVKSGPRPVSAETIVARVQARVKNAPAEAVHAALVEKGLELVLKGFLNLHMNTTDFSGAVSRKPVVYPVARLQAEAPTCTSVTNALRNPVPVDGLGCAVMKLLDGTRTLDDVVKVLVADAQAGKITVHAGGGVIMDKKALTVQIDRSVAAIAEKLAQHALLIA